jgi:hypothetical protein
LALVPVEMLDHLKEMPAQREGHAGSPRSSDLFIGQVIFAGLVDHLEGEGLVFGE